jgi:hypothetical protein
MSPEELVIHQECMERANKIREEANEKARKEELNDVV